MLHSINNLIGFTIRATDGEIGKVKDFYLDDKDWKVRYLIVETGNWLFNRKVLLAPIAVNGTDLNEKTVAVNLTQEQVKHSPDIDTEKPFSHQQESDLYRHYNWQNEGGLGFMTTGMVGGVVAPGVPFEESIANELHKSDHISDEIHHTDVPSKNSNLRSFKEMIGESLKASDEQVGELDDLLVSSSSWHIAFAVIETGNWYSGKKVLISTSDIKKTESDSPDLFVDFTTGTLKSLPEYDESQLLTDKFDLTLNKTSNYNQHNL